MKRMSTWNRFYIHAYTPLRFLSTDPVRVLVKMSKKECVQGPARTSARTPVCVYANTMFTMVIEKNRNMMFDAD